MMSVYFRKKSSSIYQLWALISVFIFVLLLHSTPALPAVYTWTDENGSVHAADDISKVPPQYRDDYQELPTEESPPAAASAVEIPSASATGSASGHPQKLTVAVIDLDVPQSLETLRVVLSDRLRSELINTGKFTVVERHKMNQILDEQKLSLTGLIDSRFAVKIGRLLGVRRIVAGSLARVGSVFSVSSRMIDVETGEITNSADMDCECPLEDVLVVTLRNVALKLAGLSAEAEGRTRTLKRLPASFSLEEIVGYALPFKINDYADMAWSGERLYIGTYDGNIYRISTDIGLKVEEVYTFKKSNISALGWDGENIWSALMGTGVIIKHRMDRSLTVDFTHRPAGADTYPYAMAIDGRNIYTGGYFKKIIQYEIQGPTAIKKVRVMETRDSVQALLTVDGRLFASNGRNLVEFISDRMHELPVTFSSLPCVGLAYDGRYIWALSNDRLTKYKVIRADKSVSAGLRRSHVNISDKYSYYPRRPVAVAWDGGVLWTMSQYGENAGVYELETGLLPGLFRRFRRWDISNSGEIYPGYDYGALASDGRYLLTSGRRSDGSGGEQNYIMRLEADHSSGRLRISDAAPVDLDNISAMAWADGFLWVASGQQTKTSGEGSLLHQMRRAPDNSWEFVKSYKYPGPRCQALAWKGDHLWSYDVFNKRFYKHRKDDDLTVIAEYSGPGGGPLEYFSGLVWDGTTFWTADYKKNNIYKLSFIDSETNN